MATTLEGSVKRKDESWTTVSLSRSFFLEGGPAHSKDGARRSEAVLGWTWVEAMGETRVDPNLGKQAVLFYRNKVWAVRLWNWGESIQNELVERTGQTNKHIHDGPRTLESTLKGHSCSSSYDGGASFDSKFELQRGEFFGMWRYPVRKKKGGEG